MLHPNLYIWLGIRIPFTARNIELFLQRCQNLGLKLYKKNKTKTYEKRDQLSIDQALNIFKNNNKKSLPTAIIAILDETTFEFRMYEKYIAESWYDALSMSFELLENGKKKNFPHINKSELDMAYYINFVLDIAADYLILDLHAQYGEYIRKYN